MKKYHLQRHDTMQSAINHMTFWRKILPPLSGYGITSQMTAFFTQKTVRYWTKEPQNSSPQYQTFVIGYILKWW